MADVQSTEIEPKSTDPVYRYQLPHAYSFDDVNRNFDDVSDTLTLLIQEMRDSSEATNQNLLKLATETSQNLNKLTSELKSVLSSQTMMFMIFLTVIGLVVIIFKSIWTAFFGPIG